MKKNIFKAVSLILVIIMIVSLAACSSATTPESIKAKGKLLVSTNAEFEPFEYKDGDKVVGIDMEIAQAIADKLGVELAVDNISFDSVLAAIPSGKCNLGISGLSITEDRKKTMLFSDPYFSASQMLIVKADSTIKTQADLKGKKVGVQLGTTGDTLCTEDKNIAEVVRFNDGPSAVLDLVNGKIDAVVIDNYPAKKLVAANEGKIILIDTPLSEEEYAIATKPGNTDLIAVVNEVLKELKDSGKMDEILAKYIKD